MTLQGLRSILRIVRPSSCKAVKSIATSTHKLFHNYDTKNVISTTCPPNMQERRSLSQNATTVAEDLTVDYIYMKTATSKKGTLIIDVREPEEVKEHGKIPNSINIPLSNVVPVLSNLTETEFQQIYEKCKPKEDTEIIFYCMIGKRSGKAQESALNLGFKKAKNYLGSWTDWASKTR